MKIITLTLNPAFDTHCFINDFKPYFENLARVTSFDACGKGVNISRALNTAGIDNTALLILGDDNANAFKKRLTDDGVIFNSITVKGKIRENITVHTEGKDETRISFEGFECDGKILNRIEAMLEDDLSDTVVTFTGRAPLGVTVKELKAFLSELKTKGARLVIDSRSLTDISDIAEVGPWLIKPNAEEIQMYTDIKVTDFESAVTAAEQLQSRGIENVMISLGGSGAVLFCNEGGFVCKAPKITPFSTIGAGDSSIAGFLAAAKLDLSKGDMLKYAVCYGSAACLTEGSAPPRKEDIDRLLTTVTVFKK